MNTTLKNLNKFVTDFLTEQGNVEQWLSNPNQSSLKSILSKTNKSKDPSEPKRAKSAYLYFCLENRDIVRKELGENAKATEITKELGIRWNALKEDTKKASDIERLEKLSQEDKKRYEYDMKSYVPISTTDKTKVKRTGPKRANSAYLYFCSANRDLVRESLRKDLGEDPKATQVTKQLGILWNKAKHEGTVGKFEELAAADKKRYFEQKESGDVVSKVVEKNTDSKKKVAEKKVVEKKVVEKKVAEKKKPSKKTLPNIEESEDNKLVPVPKKGVVETSKKSNNYQKFCSIRRPEIKKLFPDEKTIEITKRLADEWKNMSPEEKEAV